jgi:ribose 5-phosphate isomerase RpiB
VPFFRAEPEPENHDPEVHLPVSAIRPLPATRKNLMTFAVFLGLSFAATGLGTIVALNRTEAVRTQLADRAEVRDAERDAQQAQIRALAEKVRQDQERDRKAVCQALASVPDQSPVLIQLSRNYRCGTT